MHTRLKKLYYNKLQTYKHKRMRNVYAHKRTVKIRWIYDPVSKKYRDRYYYYDFFFSRERIVVKYFIVESISNPAFTRVSE